METRSGILAWKIPGTEEPGRLQSMGSQELDTAEQLNHHRHGPRQVPHSCLCMLTGSFNYQLPKVPPPNATLPGVRASTHGFRDTSGPQKTAEATTASLYLLSPGHVTLSADDQRAQSAGDFRCLLAAEQLTLPATPPPTTAFLPLRKPHSQGSADGPLAAGHGTLKLHGGSQNPAFLLLPHSRGSSHLLKSVFL